jgi:hypothetical protein
MKWPRLTTRRWLVVVVAVALIFAAGREWSYRLLRDRRSASAARLGRWADEHDRVRSFCLGSAARHAGYDGHARGFSGWHEEARHHARWSAIYREEAVRALAGKRNAEHHMIFP